ncbi:MAG: FAD-binding oxidoreductase [Planctomycetota bacterium]
MTEIAVPDSQTSSPVGPAPVPLCGWGRHPVVTAPLVRGEDLERITEEATLTRGLGRSYGDASLPEPGALVAGSTLADRILAFDESTGLLRCEAGFSLEAMNRLLLPRGWFTPVTPGTQFVTVGGMFAADVHGKNHHESGCFGEHVRRIKIRTGDGVVHEIEEDHELFLASQGGMGLTGHLLELDVQLQKVPSPWIWAETSSVPDLETMIEKLLEASGKWPYTVGWSDCLAPGARIGRGILIVGRWANPDEAPKKAPKHKRQVAVPFQFPGWVLSRWFVQTFNAAYYRLRSMTAGAGIVDPQPFYYPLDAIEHWNRVYGRRGFTQYQCVLPVEGGTASCHRFFDILVKMGGTPYLVVVKDFGKEGRGRISFPRPGITIAMDLPMRGSKTQAVVDALNEHVLEQGGRVYLAKDALTRREHFQGMEPRLEDWNELRRVYDPDGRLRSALSMRLLGDDR